jgi:hypothetical protein
VRYRTTGTQQHEIREQRVMSPSPAWSAGLLAFRSMHYRMVTTFADCTFGKQTRYFSVDLRSKPGR